MYNFILNMWIWGRIDSVKVQAYITKGYITQAEADTILATTQRV
jgi:hypothetical protein